MTHEKGRRLTAREIEALVERRGLTDSLREIAHSKREAVQIPMWLALDVRYSSPSEKETRVSVRSDFWPEEDGDAICVDESGELARVLIDEWREGSPARGHGADAAKEAFRRYAEKLRESSDSSE